jgi:hypothetical protein
MRYGHEPSDIINFLQLAGLHLYALLLLQLDLLFRLLDLLIFLGLALLLLSLSLGEFNLALFVNLLLFLGDARDVFLSDLGGCVSLGGHFLQSGGRDRWFLEIPVYPFLL